MHRFYISPQNWNPRALALTGAEAHHARDVLRMKEGDKLVLFNGQGREITAEIINLGSDAITLRKLHEAETPPLQCRIVLGQAIPKGKNMDLIVQKAVEIGAAEIAPIISDRTIVPKVPPKNRRNGSRSRLKRPSNAVKTGCHVCTRRENLANSFPLWRHHSIFG